MRAEPASLETCSPRLPVDSKTVTNGSESSSTSPCFLFCVQRPTKDGPRYFPSDSTDPRDAKHFESFALARAARDEAAEPWKFNGQIIEADALPKSAPAQRNHK